MACLYRIAVDGLKTGLGLPEVLIGVLPGGGGLERLPAHTGGECNKSCNTITCDHNCTQTPQGPKCYCPPGFSLAKNGKDCEDLDECQVYGTCSQQCTNKEGGFDCSCLVGYELVNSTCFATGPGQNSQAVTTHKYLEQIAINTARQLGSGTMKLPQRGPKNFQEKATIKALGQSSMQESVVYGTSN